MYSQFNNIALLTTFHYELNYVNPAMCNHSGAIAVLQIRLQIDM